MLNPGLWSRIAILGALGAAIVFALRPDDIPLTPEEGEVAPEAGGAEAGAGNSSPRQEIRQLLADEAARPGEHGLDEAIRLVLDEREAREYAPLAQLDPPTADFSPGEVERQIDSVPLAPFEDVISRAFDDSREGVMLRRIILGRRHRGRVPGAARLEDQYVAELAGNTEYTVRVIAEALRALPKSEFREEHVALRDLVNRLPEGYERLQAAFPDEEFR